MIVVGPINCQETEKIYIFPYKNFSVGFCFAEDYSTKEWYLHAIELCKYGNNRIQQYYVVNIDATECRVLEIALEEFLYKEDELILHKYEHFYHKENVATRTLISTFSFKCEKNKTYKYLGIEKSSAYAMSEEDLCNEWEKYENLLNQIISDE